MSAFVVNDDHIRALVAAGLQFKSYPDDKMRFWAGEYPGEDKVTLLTRDSADQIANMLLAENYRSVNHRYEEDDAPPTLTTVWTAYLARPLDPVVILKAIDCYEYQACEHDEWNSSLAYAFCEALRRRIIGCLPGYEAAPWGVSSIEQAFRA